MSEGIGVIAKNMYYAYSEPLTFFGDKGRDMVIRVIAYDDWGKADICFCFAAVNTVALAVIARTNYMKKSRIISVVCILDGAFLLWAWSQHPLGGVLKNLQTHDAALAEQTQVHSDNNLLQQQLIEEERDAFGKVTEDLTQTQQNLTQTQENLSHTEQRLAKTEESIRQTNGMTRDQLNEAAAIYQQVKNETARQEALTERQEILTVRQEAAVAKLESQNAALNEQSLRSTFAEELQKQGQQLNESIVNSLAAAVVRLQSAQFQPATCGQEAGRI